MVEFGVCERGSSWGWLTYLRIPASVQPRCTLSAHDFLEHEPGCDTKLGSAGSQQGRVESWSRQSFYRLQRVSITWIRFGPIRRAQQSWWLGWLTRLRSGSSSSRETSE